MRIITGIVQELPGEVEKCLEATVARIGALTPGEFSGRMLYRPSVHLLSRRGKLVRPTLVFLGAAALCEEPRKYVDLAASMELLHTASLIHDDLIDRDLRRRNASSVHAKYGDEAAILAGDALISKAIQLAAKYGPKVVFESARAAMEMCAGEMLDMTFQRGTAQPALGAYLRIASLKSASLMGVASGIVAVHKGHVLARRMRSFGTAAGVAFQIRDDVLELIDRKDGGEAEGAPLRNGRTNLVVALEKRYSLSRDNAVRKAIALNNRYLDMAIGELSGSKAALMGSYANLIRLSEG